MTFSMLAGAAGRGHAPWVGQSLAGAACTGGGVGGYGPWDYRLDKDKIGLVENFHFSKEVEQLRFRRLRDSVAEVTYTITKVPNHHRALYSAVRFSLMEGESSLKRRYPPAECFLQRAITYSPNDPVPYQLYGLYMHRLGEFQAGLDYYQRAEALAPNDPMLQYNIGLLLVDMKKYEEALVHASAAYRAGVALPGLRNQLKDQGYTLPTTNP